MAYNMNFKDMSRFMDDFFYLAQRGGRFSELVRFAPEDSMGRKIIKVFTTIATIFLIVFILWLLYVILFKGYPRFAADIGTFHFYRRQNIDSLYRDGNLLVKTLTMLSSPPPSCLSPYSIYQLVYQPTNLASLLGRLDQNKTKYYSAYKYNEQYYELFREFYLYYNKVDRDRTADVWHKEKKLDVRYVDFYEQLLTYKVKKGDISTNNPEKDGKKSEDELLFDLYNKEIKNNFIERQRVSTTKAVLASIGKEVDQMMKQIADTPIIPYLVVPENNAIIVGVLKDWSGFSSAIEDGSIYKVPYHQVSDYGWCAIEFTRQRPFESIVKNMPHFTNEDANRIAYYMNLSRKDKVIAEGRIMNMSTGSNKEFFDFIKKNPIFAHIYFSRKVPEGRKSVLYAKVMYAYKLMGSCQPDTELPQRLANLQQNATAFKQFITNIAYLHLFINVYQSDLTNMYEQQNISVKGFWKALFVPYMTDLVVNRVGNYAKRVFGSTAMNSSYKKFGVWYKQLGKDINRTIRTVFKAFFTSSNLNEPQPIDPDDGNNVATTTSTTPQI